MSVKARGTALAEKSSHGSVPFLERYTPQSVAMAAQPSGEKRIAGISMLVLPEPVGASGASPPLRGWKVAPESRLSRTPPPLRQPAERPTRTMVGSAGLNAIVAGYPDRPPRGTGLQVFPPSLERLRPVAVPARIRLLSAGLTAMENGLFKPHPEGAMVSPK